MESRQVANKLATASLTLGILGWILYLLQWCFDLTIGLLLAAFTAGSSALCATILDFLPFLLWLGGIVTGHAALGKVSRNRDRAVWGLVLSYFGMFFTILLIVIIVALIASGVGVGVLEKILPSLPKH